MVKKRLLITMMILMLGLTACGGEEASASISNDTPVNEEANDKAEDKTSDETINDSATDNSDGDKAEHKDLADGEYNLNITMEGGSGKAYIQSPAKLIVEDGNYRVILVWSSKNYDYMIVGGIKYMNEAVDSESTFTIPLDNIDDKLTVIGDTVAMSEPHEIEYVLTFELEE